MSSNPAIKVDNVSKCYQVYAKPFDRLKQFFLPRLTKLIQKTPAIYYKEFWALKNVSFTINKGETIGLIGRNGSGKSTLLQMICGTLSPTEGNIEINGRVAALLELGSGFNPEFTGRENIYLNATILGLTKTETDERLESIMSFADIGDFIDQPVKTYSSGMYVRLAFSVAIHVDPDILIVDEALAVGDASFQAKCMQKFEEFRNKGVTILLVTHDLGAILQFSDRCILLDHGEKLDLSDPKESVDALKKIMLGAPNNQIKNRNAVNGRLASLYGSAWASNYRLNDAGTEIYGNHKASIVDFGIFNENDELSDTKLESGKKVKFKMKVIFHQNVENPIFTLTIRDLTGKEIVGTNTKNQRMSTGQYNIGDQAEVSFLQKLRLAPGNYLITYACSGFELDNFVVYERLYHILVIEVYSYKQIVGFYDMEADITIDRVAAL